MKVCIRCDNEKDLSDFYAHNQMADGHLNVCKDCVKKRVDEREKKLRKNSDWREKERARHREKYHRLEYKEKHKASPKMKKTFIETYRGKYPEKVLAQSLSSHVRKKGYEKHHWSYKKEDAKNVVFLKKNDHSRVHRLTFYDQERMQYRCCKTNVLIDSVELFIEFLKDIGVSDYEQRNS